MLVLLMPRLFVFTLWLKQESVRTEIGAIWVQIMEDREDGEEKIERKEEIYLFGNNSVIALILQNTGLSCFRDPYCTGVGRSCWCSFPSLGLDSKLLAARYSRVFGQTANFVKANRKALKRPCLDQRARTLTLKLVWSTADTQKMHQFWIDKKTSRNDVRPWHYDQAIEKSQISVH